MLRQMFAKKSISLLLQESKSENRLRRILGPVSLTSLGVGCTIGAGIFVVTGSAANTVAGPALILSFVVAGIACIFSALCYAEFAAMVPVAGSAYTYAYATLGELFAWIIGWDLIIEYTIAASSVAKGWSGYFQSFLKSIHKDFPQAIGRAPFEVTGPTGHIDLPALLITLILTVVLVIGIKESTRFNNIMVGLKVAIVCFVIAVGAFFVHPGNWHPFAPFGYGGVKLLWGKWVFGTIVNGKPLGMLAGAAMIFYAYIGFDTVSAHSEEARNPQRDVPIGIIASLIICSILYIAVAAILTGMVPYNMIDTSAPVSNAFRQVGLGWAHFIVSLGAMAGLTSVLLALMLGQPRVSLAMARDGLLPPNFFGAIHPKFRTPYKSTILTGCLVAIMASVIPLQVLVELISIGTLFAFVIVCLAVLIVRYTNPGAHRPFRCPMVPLVPILGMSICLLLMSSLDSVNWLRLGIWMVVGLVIYFLYGRRHSVLENLKNSEPDATPIEAKKG
ncbi:MAG: amino acid permease [Armatimonadetes bacterium]|nr:amino acid permease [Armatimonadota bacterium]